MSGAYQAGIALRDTIDVSSVIRGDTVAAAKGLQPARKNPRQSVADMISRNGHSIGRTMRFLAILAIGAGAALTIALGVNDLLTDVFSQVRMGLSQ